MTTQSWLGAFAVVMSLGTATAAQAQGADPAWAAILEKAKGQTLVINDQGNKAIDVILDTFSKKYGIKVDATVGRPSSVLPRLKTEQDNNQFLWDVWWAITSNMVNVAAPAGMFERFEDYLILPEVKDVANWRHPDYIWGDAGHFVFTYSHEVAFSAYRNVTVAPEVKIDSFEALLDPRLKGKIAMRDASAPNAGSFALSPIYKNKGGDFLKKLLKEQDPKVFENPQQIDTAMIRGSAAIAFGMQGQSYSQCKAEGACNNVEPLKYMATAVSHGFGVLKHPPHPEATKVFLNWILGKEGQSLFVSEWAKYNDTGAVSMRKDVPPAPAQANDLPDFSDPTRYVWVSTDVGNEEIEAVVKIFKDYADK